MEEKNDDDDEDAELKIAMMMRRRRMKRKTVRQFSILAGHQTRVTTGVRLRHAHPYTTKYIHKR